MAGESFIITPDNNIVNIVGGDSPVFDQLTNQFKLGGVVEQLPDVETLNAYKKVIIANMISAGAAIDLSGLPSAAIWLTGVMVPNPPGFTVPNSQATPPTTAADSFYIKGAGFKKTTLGTLWLEDATGGPDDNGISYSVTYVDAYTLFCTFVNVGDDDLVVEYGYGVQNPCILYYKDSNAVMSNILQGMFDGISQVIINYP